MATSQGSPHPTKSFCHFSTVSTLSSLGELRWFTLGPGLQVLWVSKDVSLDGISDVKSGLRW